MDGKRKTFVTIATILFACLCLSSVVIGIALNEPEPKTVDDFVKKYGGSPAAYSRILSLNDCDVLQAEFETASANNQREPAGSAQSQWTLGFMTAADHRMKELACYDQ